MNVHIPMMVQETPYPAPGLILVKERHPKGALWAPSCFGDKRFVDLKIPSVHRKWNFFVSRGLNRRPFLDTPSLGSDTTQAGTFFFLLVHATMVTTQASVAIIGRLGPLQAVKTWHCFSVVSDMAILWYSMPSWWSLTRLKQLFSLFMFCLVPNPVVQHIICSSSIHWTTSEESVKKKPRVQHALYKWPLCCPWRQWI